MAFCQIAPYTSIFRHSRTSSVGSTSMSDSPTCCISHLFHSAALLSPHKLAVIHASGGPNLARNLHNSHVTTSTLNSLQNSEINISSTSDERYIYEGDECFTYSEILSAVESLSVKLRGIFDGGDDPDVINPNSDFDTSDRLVNSQVYESPVKQCSMIPRIVGIYLEPSIEYIVAVLAVLRCGEAFMPLDPSWPIERVFSLLVSSNTDLIIGYNESVNGNGLHKLDKISWIIDKGYCPVLPISISHYVQERCDSSKLAWPCEREKLSPFCYIIHTSGSTGRPKGVCGTEKGLLNRFLWMQEQYPLEGNELLLFKTPVSFVDHLQEFLGALLTTCTLIVPPLIMIKENMFHIVGFLQAYAINRFIAVPSLMRAIHPVMQDPLYRRIQSSLKLLVLSGEVFHLTLWQKLADLLPNTVILNLYGSTEVAGDCTYFDCKRLPLILKNETPESVPIGVPISNCHVRIGEDGEREGELYVSGQCIAAGYYSSPSIMPLAHIEESYNFHGLESRKQYNFRTGDLVRQLQCGDFVFLGRKDRLIKINGHRIALEEIEVMLREHPDLIDAVVVSSEGPEGITLLEAHLVRKLKVDGDASFCSSIRGWMLSKLPIHMVPTRIYCRETLPMSSSGKVDYTALSSWTSEMGNVRDRAEELSNGDLIQNIQKVFSDALTVEYISIYDDFFEMGGNSVSAAFASHKLGINMKLLYSFPTPLKLQRELLRKISFDCHQTTSSHKSLDTKERKGSHSVSSTTSLLPESKLKRLSTVLHGANSGNVSKLLKMDNVCSGPKEFRPGTSASMRLSCAFSRSNSVMHGGDSEEQRLHQPFPLLEIPRCSRGSMQEIWKVYLESCVDASPLIVFRGSESFLFIGSHSFKFVCVNVNSGSVHWEIKLQGRIECSAAILDDFSQVVVGCYQGKIYFIDFLSGGICWTFQTGGEVKSQPVIDKRRHVVWCGSYDHNLYALDYKSYSCIYKHHCGGSIFGSPAIDEVQEMLFVASTGGQVTAISLKEGWPCSITWVKELEGPVFGSLLIDYSNGNVICCSVDGNVYAIDATGSTVWKARTGGPIFGGPCISHCLPSQVLICSRDGSIYSFELETGDLLWEHSVGQPITSSAYVDETSRLTSDSSHLSDRLVCVCTSSGRIHVLRIDMNASKAVGKTVKVVEEFARFDLDGDIFSSPVMIGGKVFIGCRDDYVHCIKLDK